MWQWIHATPGWMTGCIGLVAHNPEWALGLAFLGAIIEALAIVGMFVPGTFIVMGVAGAAAAPRPRRWAVCLGVGVGGKSGGVFSFWGGFRFPLPPPPSGGPRPQAPTLGRP